MRYMLLMVRNDKAWGALSAEDRAAAYWAAVEYSEDLRKRGLYERGDPLESSTLRRTRRIDRSEIRKWRKRPAASSQFQRRGRPLL